MIILETIFSYALVIAFPAAFFILSYVGLHMVFEKDAKKTIPLLWEPGGLLFKLYKKLKKKITLIFNVKKR